MSCKIYLDDYHGKYGPGDKVEGRVECYLEEATKIRGIEIRLTCKEHNEWIEYESYWDSESKETKTRSVTYSGDQVIHRSALTLYDARRDEVIILPDGKHVFPFDFTLPRDIPSSFEGPHGYVGYRLKVVVDRPWNFDYEDIQSLKVLSLIDINQFPREYLEPHNYSDQKSVCCWCCAGGDITMDVNLPSLALIVGQTVPFQVTITNLSNVSVVQLKVKLTKSEKYSVDSPSWKSRESEEEILSFTKFGVGAHGEFTYDLEIKVPDHIEVPNFNQCKYFECTYNLRATAEMDGCTWDLDLDMYPKIGHVALSPYQVHVIDRPPQPGFAPDFTPSPYPPQDHNTGPPPSYTSATTKEPCSHPPGPGFVIPSAPVGDVIAPPVSASAPPSYGDVQKDKLPNSLD